MSVSSALSEEYVSTGYGCQPCSCSAEQGKMYFPPVAIGSAIPSHVSLLILHTQAESGAYSRDFIAELSSVPKMACITAAVTKLMPISV